MNINKKIKLKNKIKNLLKNNNFRNNQNYILELSYKKKYLEYAYTIKREKTLLKTRQLFIQNYFNDRFKTGKLYKGNYGYIKKPSFTKKISLNMLNNTFFVFGLLSLLATFKLLFFGGDISYNNNLIILDDKSFLDRFIELKGLLIVTLIIILIGFIKKYFFSYNEIHKYLIFKEYINSNKIIIYRYK